jgi:hypothetical protein
MGLLARFLGKTRHVVQHLQSLCAALDPGVHAPPLARRISARDGDDVLMHVIKKQLTKRAGLERADLVSRYLKCVWIGLRSQPVCSAQLHGTHELLVHVCLQ